jgi:hypothetical protein
MSKNYHEVMGTAMKAKTLMTVATKAKRRFTKRRA